LRYSCRFPSCKHTRENINETKQNKTTKQRNQGRLGGEGRGWGGGGGLGVGAEGDGRSIESTKE